jgi:hypothetical protein
MPKPRVRFPMTKAVYPDTLPEWAKNRRRPVVVHQVRPYPGLVAPPAPHGPPGKLPVLEGEHLLHGGWLEEPAHPHGAVPRLNRTQAAWSWTVPYTMPAGQTLALVRPAATGLPVRWSSV